MAEEYVVAKEEPVCGVAPVSLGIGSMLRIPVPGSKGLSIELSPRGWTPKGGTSSSLFIQDLTGKRHLRLDFGYNKNSQATEWHWNQKGTQADFGIKNHSSVGAEEQALGEFAAYYRVGGRVLLVAGAAIDAYSIVTSSRPLRRSVQVVSGWTGATGGCRLLGAGGAEIGTLVAPGLGTAVGGFFGCAVGAFLGYETLSRSAGYLFDWMEGARFSTVDPDTVVPRSPIEFGGGTSGGGGAGGSW